jgi:predicted nucleic acid-binding protein
VIVLDTNVVSALMRHEPDPIVVAWLDGLPAESVWTTSITVFEVRMGLEILAAGRRRHQLEDAFAKALEEDLDGRVLSFDPAAAQAAGRIAAERRRVGRTVEFRDVQIAGIVNVRKATLATRNTRHFEGCGLVLVDPWSI